MVDLGVNCKLLGRAVGVVKTIINDTIAIAIANIDAKMKRTGSSSTADGDAIKRPKVIPRSLSDLIQELDVPFPLMQEMMSTWTVLQYTGSSSCGSPLYVHILTPGDKNQVVNNYKFKLVFQETLPGLHQILSHPKWQPCTLCLRYNTNFHGFEIRLDITINSGHTLVTHIRSSLKSTEFNNLVKLNSNDCLTVTYSLLQDETPSNLTLSCHLEEALLKGCGLPDDVQSTSKCILNQSLFKFLLSPKDFDMISKTELPPNMYNAVDQSIGQEISELIIYNFAYYT